MDRSKKDLQANEVRAIRIGEEAIVELLWETLQEMGESLFDLPDNSDAMFHMRWNREKNRTSTICNRRETYNCWWKRINYADRFIYSGAYRDYGKDSI